MMLVYLIGLSVLTMGAVYSSPISSCEQKLKQTQASLTEKMNQMIDALYSSSPLLSKLKPTNTTPASTTTASNESPGDPTYEYAFASPYPVFSSSPQVVYVAPPTSPATGVTPTVTIAASPSPAPYFTTLEPGLQPTEVTYPSAPNSVAPRSVSPYSFQQYTYPTPQYTPPTSPISFPPSAFPAYSTSFDYVNPYPTAECTVPACTPAPLPYPSVMSPQSFYQSYQSQIQPSTSYTQQPPVPYTPPSPVSQPSPYYQPAPSVYPTAYPSQQLYPSTVNCIPPVSCYPMPLPGYPQTTALPTPSSYFGTRSSPYPSCPMPSCIPYSSPYSYSPLPQQPELTPQFPQ